MTGKTAVEILKMNDTRISEHAPGSFKTPNLSGNFGQSLKLMLRAQAAILAVAAATFLSAAVPFGCKVQASTTLPEASVIGFRGEVILGGLSYGGVLFSETPTAPFSFTYGTTVIYRTTVIPKFDT